MNKAERARQLTRQTTEQKQSLEEQNRIFHQFTVQKLESHSDRSGTIMQNQEELKYSLKSQLAVRNSQKKVQEIWILKFPLVTVPLLAFWVLLLVYWIL